MTSNFEFFKRRRVDGHDKKGGAGCKFRPSNRMALLAKVYVRYDMVLESCYQQSQIGPHQVTYKMLHHGQYTYKELE
eukprot:scaffold25103_cov118-Skeletonema_dohrnii-CCMP3373.AAC.1